MANALATLFTDIADSIRSKTGSTEKLSPSEFASQIDNISVGGGGAEGCVTVTFMNGDNVLLTRPVYIGDDCPDPVTQGRIETPTKESTVQYHYTYKGWSEALTNITEDKVIYATYTETVRTYTVTFYDEDGTTVLNTEQVAYGSSSTYVPTKDNCMFLGWTPEPKNIKGDLNCVSAWEELVVEVQEITDSWEDIIASVNDGSYVSKYKIGNYKPLDLGSEGTVNMQIAAFNADTLADGSGKSAISWVSKECLATKRRMNPNLEQIYSYPEIVSWKEESNNTWVSQNRWVISDAKAKWTITATSSGTLSIKYKTAHAKTQYNKMSLVVNGTTVVTDYANSTDTTYTVEVGEGDIVTVEATFSIVYVQNYMCTIVFESTGTFTTTADIENTPTRVTTGFKEFTGVLGGWEHSELRNYLKNTLKPLIPTALRSAIKSVTKTANSCTNDGVFEFVSTAEDVWVPSYREMFGDVPFSKGVMETLYEPSGVIYGTLFPDNASRVKTLSGGSAATSWGLRSMVNYTLQASAPNLNRIAIVLDNMWGDTDDGTAAADFIYTSYGVVLGFCI